MLQLGIIGCGRVTTMFHLKAINMLDNIKIVALSDVNEYRLRNAARKTDTELLFTDYRDLINDPNITAVVINTPPEFHSEMVKDALKSGKHVLCEKPLAQEITDLVKIKKISDANNLSVLPAHNYVFSPSIEMALKLYGEIGDLESVSLCFKNNLKSYRPHTNFRTLNNRGIIEDVLPHLLSVLFPFTGYPVKVLDTRWWCSSYDVCDNLETYLKGEENVDVRCRISWTSLIPKFTVKIEGSEGSIETDLMWNPYNLKLSINGNTKVYKSRGLGWYLDLVRFKHPSFRNQYIHFNNILEGTETPRVTVDDEIEILRILNKVSNYVE